jgi:hypothetical protein
VRFVSRHTLARAAIALAVLASVPAAAQDVATPEELGRYRLGPVRFTPAITVSNLGVDTNVFNEAADPKQDFTAAFGPKADLWMRVGRGLLSGEVALEYFYFQEYDSQRSFGTNDRLRFEVPVGRLTPFAEVRYVNTRQRPGYEIDARARRTSEIFGGGVDLRLGGLTVVRATGGRERYRFASEDGMIEAGLSQELDRDSDAFKVAVRRQLTPLTTFVVSVEQRWDRFVYESFRDADALGVTPGFEFKPFALIDGSLYVGYRHFRTLSAAVPDYTGPSAAVDLGYTVRATRLTGRVTRDVTYSFDELEPYYVLTDAGLTVIQRITSHWDVKGSASRGLLDYEAVAITTARTDHVSQYGFGGGYRLGETVRFGVDANHVKRESELPGRSYEGWRIGGTIDYGVKQR